jgi:hypothetical protein
MGKPPYRSMSNERLIQEIKYLNLLTDRLSTLKRVSTRTALIKRISETRDRIELLESTIL